MSDSLKSTTYSNGRFKQSHSSTLSCGYRPEQDRGIALTERAGPTCGSVSLRDDAPVSGRESGQDALYPLVLVLERTGPLNVAALSRCLHDIMHHHGPLGALMHVSGGTSAASIESDGAVQIGLEQTSSLTEEQDAAVLRALAEEAQHVFNSHHSLFRARLIHSDQRSILLIAAPPMTACDGSLESLARSLNALSERYSGAMNLSFPNEQDEHFGVVDSPRNRPDLSSIDRHIRYWRERLAGSPPPVELPFDHPRPLARAFRRACMSCVFEELGKPLQAFSQKEGVTPFAALMTGFQALVLRYTTQDDLIIGTNIRAADEHAAEGPGCAQSLPLRIDASGDPPFRELLERVSCAIRDDAEHRQIPFEYLAAQIEPARDLLKNPFWRIQVSPTWPVIADGSGWRILDMNAATPAVDLHVQLGVDGDSVRVAFTYAADLFDDTTVTRIAHHYETLLKATIANSCVRLSELPLLKDAERGQLLYTWNDTASLYPNDKCTHELFEEQVRRTPRAQAVSFEKETLSYAELNGLANQLAHRLRRLGATPDSLIGVCVERSARMVAGLLGILKSGAAYVPLDPQFPSSRLDLMLEDSGVTLLVIEESVRSRFSGFRGRLVCIDSEELLGESAEDGPNTAKPYNLAYVIYTSGSTGKPKGVAITHGALVNFLWSMRERPGLTRKDTMLAVTTICFDIAALELYLPLIVGGCVAVANRETAADGNKLQQLIEETQATVMQATPATWRLLLEAGWTGKSNLKILCGGEAMPRDLVRELLKRSSELWNMYGPTETTVWSTVSRIVSEEDPITIGKPIANTNVYVLIRLYSPCRSVFRVSYISEALALLVAI